MSVGATSYFRFKIPYKVFYAVHHVVFIAYILTILHTIDVVQRKQGGRSQSFKWFSASLLLYICDRTAMYLNNRYVSKMQSSYAIESDVDEKMVILKVKSPVLFNFQPGQYVYLKIPSIDNRWHPYSIGSAPQAETLDFYIKVSKDTSWSGKLFTLMKNKKESRWNRFADWEDDPVQNNEESRVEILGPYGVGLGDESKYSQALLVGTGTGFVPCLSLLQEHIGQCITINPNVYDKEVVNNTGVLKQISRRNLSGHKTEISDSAVSQMAEMMKRIESARTAKKQVIIGSFSLLGPILGVLVYGLTLSWGQLPFDLYRGMGTILMTGTILFQLSFLILAVVKYSQDARKRDIWVYVDFTVLIISAIHDGFLFWNGLWGARLNTPQLVYCSLLMIYMIVRFIGHVIASSENPIEEANKRKVGLVVLNKVKFVWVSRSATAVSQVYPDIAVHWDKLVAAWGLKRAKECCEIVIHCTDKNRIACQDLVDALQSTALFKENGIKFGRPSFEKLLDQNTTEIIANSEKNVATRTMFAFCGSERLGRKAKEANQYNDIFLSMTGYTQHVVDMEIHSYGGLFPGGGSKGDGETASFTGSDEGTINNNIVPDRCKMVDSGEILSRRRSGYVRNSGINFIVPEGIDEENGSTTSC